MDLFALRTFLCVQETRSFSRAGEQLLLTQPAVSKRIAALESELGVRLFDRVGRQVLLTEAGRELYSRAQPILLALDDCRRSMSNLSETVSGRLSFATSHHIGLHRLPPILRQFTADYPEVELDICFMDSEQACMALVKGRVELALATLPNDTPPSLEATPVWHDPLIPVIGRGHGLAMEGDADREIAARQLAAYPAILPGSDTFTRELIDQAFASHGLVLQVKLATNYLETIMMLVSVGLGWGILPDSMVQVQAASLYRLQVAGITVERTLGVIRHQQRTLSMGAQAMLALLDRNGCTQQTVQP